MTMTTVSSNPDDAKGGGLPDDFDGTTMKVYLRPYYVAARDDELHKYALAAYVEIKPDTDSEHWLRDGEEVIKQRQSNGNLALMIPSATGDDQEPAGASFEEYQALANGDFDEELTDDELEQLTGTFAIPALGRAKESQLAPGSNWHVYRTAIGDLGFTNWSVDNRVYEGFHGHFMRIDQPERDFVGQQSSGRRGQVLVMTSITNLAEVNSTSAKSAKSASTKRGAAAKGSRRGRAKVGKATKELVTDDQKRFAQMCLLDRGVGMDPETEHLVQVDGLPFAEAGPYALKQLETRELGLDAKTKRQWKAAILMFFRTSDDRTSHDVIAQLDGLELDGDGKVLATDDESGGCGIDLLDQAMADGSWEPLDD